jgi:S1-C subfamily serine protease
MNWLDYAILVMLVLAAVHGWRTGATRQVAALAGLAGGLLAGLLVAPRVAGLVAPQYRGIAAVIFILTVALAVASLAGVVGGYAAAGLRQIRLGVLDDIAGSVVAVASGLLLVWFFGNMLGSSGNPTLDRGLQGSVVLRDVDQSLPSVPAVFARVERLLTQDGFPVVFAELPPQLLPPAAQPPVPAVRRAFDAVGPSTVKVIGPACGVIVEGSGFVAAPEIVVTNAHVVAGDTAPRVLDTAGSHAATVIGFDPELDVAVLSVPGLDDPVLPLDSTVAARGTRSVALGYPGDGPLTALPAAVDGVTPATGLDIYGGSVVTRTIYQLHAAVRPGNSGGPLVVRTGAGYTAIGLVFARSTSDANVGYALAMGPVAHDIAVARTRSAPAGTGTCVG